MFSDTDRATLERWVRMLPESPNRTQGMLEAAILAALAEIDSLYAELRTDLAARNQLVDAAITDLVIDARATARDTFHHVQVALLAQINQWRFQSEASAPEEQERAQALRECAYDLERLLAQKWPTEEETA